MGERVEVGPFTYVVVESSWRSQLGEGFDVRTPQNRFLILTVSITNGGSSEATVPLLTLEGSNGQEFQELADGTGVPDWLGVLRSVKSAGTLQGRLVFDVPLSSFRLKLPDGGEPGYEKYAFVDVPLRIDVDQVQSPLPGSSQK
ncbi:MAG: DUF4352 domain-containing protein [Acidobacteriota bacterium]